MKKIMIFASALALIACGGSKDDSQTQTEKQWRSEKQAVVYSYPTDGQLEVPNSAPVVLSFSSAISATHPEEHITVTASSTGEAVPVTAKQVDNGTSLVLTPEKRFNPLEEYQVEVGAISLEEGVSKPLTLRFNTRGLAEGPAKLMAQEQFEVVRRFPDGTEQLPVVDFSSFRYQFSQPIAVETARYGEQITLLDASDSVVEAEVLVHGAYLTIDPKEDLRPDTQYTLAIDGLQSTQEQSYSDSWSFTPKDTTSPTTGKREKLVQEISANGEGSPLTGNTINKVPMASVLLGEGTATQASGVLEAELAFVPHFPDVTPFRIAKGSLIKGSDIDVLIGGLVPAGFNSGDIRMHFISDATGYLMPNAYSDQPDAPRHVRLFMDMAISAETDKANGAITQDLMHIELAGTAIVEDGSMVINAVGVVEPNVLGSEYASGLLSFYMKSFEDQVNPPAAGEDDRPLVLQTWVPGEAPDAFLENDPVVLQFNKPISKQVEINNAFNVFENGNQIPNDELIVTASGNNIYINKQDGWNRSHELKEYDYRIELAGGDVITDIYNIAANPLPGMEFSLPIVVKEHVWNIVQQISSIPDPIIQPAPKLPEYMLPVYAGIILAANPGYPCLLDTTKMDLSNNTVGSCLGSLQEEYESISGEIKINPMDLIPLENHPKNKPITLVFSKKINPDSVVLNKSFFIEEVNSSDLSVVNNIDGTLKVKDKTIVFSPSRPWEKGSIYRYTLKSGNACDQEIEKTVCTQDGLPIKSKIYSAVINNAGRIDVSGGNPIEGDAEFSQFFKGDEATESVYLSLANSTSDINANFFHEWNYDLPDSGGVSQMQVMRWSNYEVTERGIESSTPLEQPDSADPNGIEAPSNSAKILSLANVNPNAAQQSLSGLNVGCGFKGDSAGKAESFQICPKNKFTYLTSSLMTELTGEYNKEKGVQIKIHPGQIMATSLSMYTTTFGGQLMIGLDTGPQIMRLRYAKGEGGERNKLITGWIKSINGKPQLSIDLDMYIDAFSLTDQFSMTGLTGLSHNLLHMPINLKFSGPVNFLNDGRMEVSLANTNDAILTFEIEGNTGASEPFNLKIPLGGVNLDMTTKVIFNN